jgi:hypothetical protein
MVGCPLSPIGGVVVNALIRWLESKGGGYKQGSSGEEYKTLLFADDSTLLTESKKAMQTLMDTFESFSEWSEPDKSELTEIRDLGVRLQKSKADLGEKKTIGEGKMTYLEPIRRGNCEDDKSNRGTSVLAVAEALGGTGSHNAHIQILSGPGRVDREGHPRAGEDMGKSFSTGLENREEHPEVTFWALRKHRGLGCLSARAIVTQEVIGLMRQSAELEDDLKGTRAMEEC